MLIVRYELNSYVVYHLDEVCALNSFNCFTAREQNRVKLQCNGITSDTHKYRVFQKDLNDKNTFP